LELSIYKVSIDEGNCGANYFAPLKALSHRTKRIGTSADTKLK